MSIRAGEPHRSRDPSPGRPPAARENSSKSNGFRAIFREPSAGGRAGRHQPLAAQGDCPTVEGAVKSPATPGAAPRAEPHQDSGGEPGDGERRLPDRIEPLELALAAAPFERAPAVGRAASMTPAAPPPDPVALAPLLVRRLAWGGDARRGTARIEVGAGALGGSTITVEAADGEICVDLDLAPGIDPRAVEARLRARLARRGVRVGAIVAR